MLASLIFYQDPLSKPVTLPQGSALLLSAAPWWAIFKLHMFNFATCDNLKSITMSIPTETHRIHQDLLRGAELRGKPHCGKCSQQSLGFSLPWRKANPLPFINQSCIFFHSKEQKVIQVYLRFALLGLLKKMWSKKNSSKMQWGEIHLKRSLYFYVPQ